MMYLPSLSDAELVAHGNATADSLTQSDLERELLKRLEARVEHDTLPLIQIAEEFDIDPEALRAVLEAHPGDLNDYKALLAKLSDYDIHTVAHLEEQIERSHKFYDIANDAGDALARLAALAAETL